MSPDRSIDSLDFSSAHISGDIHRHQQGAPIRQQPSPDSSDQSGVSVDHLQTNATGSFRTSTPHRRGHGNGRETDASLVRPQRIFPQNYNAQSNEYGHYFVPQQQTSTNRKHSRERYVHDDGDQAQSGKRQRNAHDPHMRTVLDSLNL